MKQLTKKQIVTLILCSLLIALFSPFALSSNALMISSIPTASVFLSPSRISGINQTVVNVNLNVSNIEGVSTWGAGLMFNHHTAKCTKLTEGDFLSGDGTYPTLFLKGKINSTLGIVGASGDTEEGTTVMNGSGTLMIFQLQMNGTGTSYSDLHIIYFEAIAVDGSHIPCKTIDYFTTSPGPIVQIVGNPQGATGTSPYPGFNKQSFANISQTIGGTTYNRNMSFVIYSPALASDDGFFNVTIPNALISGSWNVTLNGAVQTPLITTLNSTHTMISLQFTYSSPAIEAVQILGTFGAVATAPPTYSGITKSTSYAGYSCTFGITWQDKVALSQYIFSFDNGGGSFTNDTATAFTSNPQTISSTKTLTAKVGATVQYRWYASASNTWNSTAVQTFVTTDGTPPTYSSITHNTTTPGTACMFSITCSDNGGLSKYIFSFDNGVGSFTNNTATAFTSNPQTISVTKTLITTVNATIRFRWFFNDTSNNWNSTAIQSFTATFVTVSITGVVPVGSAALHGVPKNVFAKGYHIYIDINVTVTGLGSYSETFTVTASANATVIAVQNVNLTSGGNAFTLVGNTSNLAYGHYIVSVNIANNHIASNTIITVAIPGDMNADGKVWVRDLYLLGRNWGLTVPPGDPRADINGDGVVGPDDFNILKENWGQP